eukprot:5817088-Amphidinium_carterae.1
MHRNPRKITARHAYAAEYFRKCAAINEERGHESDKISQQKVIALHGKHWSRLPPEKRARYSSEADAM